VPPYVEERLMKKLLIAVVVGVLVVSAQPASASPIVLPQIDPPLVPNEFGQIITTFWSADKPTPKMWPTDAKGKEIQGPNIPKVGDAFELSRTKKTPPQKGQKLWSVSFDLPKLVQTGQENGKVTDAEVKDGIVKWFDSKGIQLAQLNLESTSQDPATGEYRLDNIFGVLAANRGLEEVDIPLLVGDTNGDGEVGGPDDLLYNLVDLRFYLAGTPSSDDFFTIINGTVTSLPGMFFSTSPFTFDPLTGFSGTPYSGPAYVGGSASAAAVPEAGTLALVATFLLPLVATIRRGRISSVVR
jgi:hypothetical protein